MKLSRRRTEEAQVPAGIPAGTQGSRGDGGSGAQAAESANGKGRPTPKRRDAVAPRGPVSAPKTRKEAYARQKELAKAQKAARRTPTAQLTVAQRRELLKSGDPSVLPKRDRGPTKALARDYVDSHRMASTYLLILFPLIAVGWFLPFLQLVVLVVFVALLFEWYLTGKRVRRLAIARNGSAEGTNLSIGFYAGSRAYIPRRWRLPAARVGLGDEI